MKTLVLMLALGAALFGAPPAQSPVPEAQRIQIMEKGGVVGLYVPAGGLVMMFPKQGFARKEPKGGGGLANPRYFYFEKDKGAVILSGWFEPASRFKGVSEEWAALTGAWKGKAELEAHEVSKVSVAQWQGQAYQTRHPGGVRAHLKVHWVEAGTWIDLHLSAAAPEGADKALAELKTLLASFGVKPLDPKS